MFSKKLQEYVLRGFYFMVRYTPKVCRLSLTNQSRAPGRVWRAIQTLEYF